MQNHSSVFFALFSSFNLLSSPATIGWSSSFFDPTSVMSDETQQNLLTEKGALILDHHKWGFGIWWAEQQYVID